MSSSPVQHASVPTTRWPLQALALATAVALSACGGGGSSDNNTAPTDGTPVENAPVDTSSYSLELAAADPDAPALDATTGAGDNTGVTAEPAFHAAPVLLAAPDGDDAIDNSASARRAPRSTALGSAAAARSTRGITVQAIQDSSRRQALGNGTAAADGPAAAPLANTSSVTTYTPAQVRAAYGLPTLPAAAATPSSLTAAQRAQLGAGQTVYIVNAKHNPNVAAELTAFNSKFGLPGCTTKAIASTATLPLAPALATEGCNFSVVYSTAAGGRTNTAPAYDAGWATEIALDVQWAHATAPLARIVLIEAPDAGVASLSAAVRLANAMGAGVVSMSFGAAEGSWVTSYDNAFTGTGMTYLAATGDSGSQVSWPSASSRVLAVGGTTLNWAGTGTRSETGWSKTGGGLSAYFTTPAWQQSGLPGVGALSRRGVADVAFNADPSTGQFVAVQAPGATSPSWISAGGTSLSTPQWAGLIAVANALRAQAGTPVLGAPHQLLYKSLAATPGGYAANFADIASGSNGTCGTCKAAIGYDQLTGLGSPNAGALLTALAGGSSSTTPVAPTAPSVTSATLTGKVGTALSAQVAVSAPNPVTYSLTGAPSGVALSTTGVLSWAAPVAGTYSVTVSAKDSKTGLVGQGTLTLNIAAATSTTTSGAPVVIAPAMTGVAGKLLTGTLSFSDPAGRALSITITGVPAGMGFSVSGLKLTASWPSPVTGKYTMNITARNSAGLTTQLAVPITINAK